MLQDAYKTICSRKSSVGVHYRYHTSIQWCLYCIYTCTFVWCYTKLPDIAYCAAVQNVNQISTHQRHLISRVIYGMTRVSWEWNLLKWYCFAYLNHVTFTHCKRHIRLENLHEPQGYSQGTALSSFDRNNARIPMFNPICNIEYK